MSRKVWVLLAVVVAVGFGAIPVLAQAATPINQGSTPIKVTPKTGGRTTHFGVSWRANQTFGHPGASVTGEYSISVTGPNRSGCISSASDGVTESEAGSMVHVKLNPKNSGGKWCTGKFHGVVRMIMRPSCGCPPTGVARARSMIFCPMIACPLQTAARPNARPTRAASPMWIAEMTVGTFSFRVRKHL